ncbi:MAG: alanine racemase [Psychrobacter sp.]|nr:alanine racemase [Psychrobacter sp.]
MDFANITPPSAPSAWLDLDALDANIKRVNQMIGDTQLRVATKSVRCIDVLKYVREHSPNFLGLMSYSARESVYLLEQGFDNILCAYPTLDKEAIAQTLSFVNQGAVMVWMVDNFEQWQLLEDVGREHNTVLDVCLDINMSMTLPKIYFGTKRSRLFTIADVKKLLKTTKKFKHSKVTAMMGYEGQIAGLPEHLPDKAMLAPAIRGLKSLSKKQVSSRRPKIADWLNSNGYPLSIVNGGGSGSMLFTCAQPEVTEITVGSAYYYPALFSYMDSMQDFSPAAGFVLPVTRHPEPKVITCHGGGFIASGALGTDKAPLIVYPENLSILNDEGFGEVQTPMQAKGKLTVGIGDYVWCQHSKAGELCEHFNELITYRRNKACGTMQTYRGAGQCFH